ncbi:MAG: MFS transporter [Finegoldia sp.]|nr:MFS transporter [Finegoldia sp.]
MYFLIVALQMSGQSLNTLQGPMLEAIGAMEYFSLASIISILGLTIMTPIGGKLGDLVGRRNMVLFAGLVSMTCRIGLSFTSSAIAHILFRFVLGAATGAFISVPYILAREINEEKVVPRMMGFLASGMAVGGLLGGLIAGALMDLGYMRPAIVFPIIPLIIGVTLITLNLPNKKAERKIKVDVPGILTLTPALTILIIAINYAPKKGFTDIKVLGGLIIGIILAILFVKIEKKAEEPIIPFRLLKNKNYVILLVIGLIGYFYMNSMNIYAPLVAINVMQQPKSVAGILQLPRTIITMILPIFTGVWVAKKVTNHKIAMIIATALVAIPMFVMSFAGANASVILYMTMLGVTGIAESFRGVSITTMAQTCLEPQDLGIGTSLVNFVNTFAGLLSSSIFGIAYDLKTKANPADPALIASGASSIYMLAGIVSVVGVLIVLFMTKDIFNKEKGQLR